VEVEEFFDLIFYRPLGFLFVKLVQRTSITPNQITILSAVAGVAAGFFIAAGTTSALLSAGLLLIVYDVLDCSDGQLARLKQNGSRMGRILDGAADYLVSVAAYLGIGFGYANHAAVPVLMWVLTIAAAFSNAIQAGLLDFYRTRFLDYLLHRVSVLEDDLEEFRREYHALKDQKGRLGEKIILWLYLQYSSIQRFAVTWADEHAQTASVTSENYVRANKILMRFWTFLGPTTQVTLLILACFFNVIGFYLWFIVVGGNLAALTLKMVQNRIDAKVNLNKS
jgi:phosphatidylglycerophosphate synthase